MPSLSVLCEVNLQYCIRVLGQLPDPSITILMLFCTFSQDERASKKPKTEEVAEIHFVDPNADELTARTHMDIICPHEVFDTIYQECRESGGSPTKSPKIHLILSAGQVLENDADVTKKR